MTAGDKMAIIMSPTHLLQTLLRQGVMAPIEVTLDEDEDVVTCKKRKVEEEIGEKKVRQMSRLELEKLLETKVGNF